MFTQAGEPLQLLRDRGLRPGRGPEHLLQPFARNLGPALLVVTVDAILAFAALRFAKVSTARHAKAYVPYMLALAIGLLLIICVPELSLLLPRSAGFVR